MNAVFLVLTTVNLLPHLVFPSGSVPIPQEGASCMGNSTNAGAILPSEILPLLLTPCVTLNKSLTLSVFHFSHL